jgi:MHS family proline/betaine transporter-like MFS transporter
VLGEPGLAPARSDSRVALALACLTNAIEWYDFAIYGAFASVLAAVLLPAGAGDRGLVVIFTVFPTSFLARPVGALFVGTRADLYGRRRLLATMLLLMSGATCAIGMVPPWSVIGAAAPAALVILRMVQGFSSGGEISTSVPFIVEHAPVDRRGFYGGWHTTTVALGVGAGLGVAALASWGFSTVDLHRYGWRLPFLLALPLGLVGLFFRKRLADTPEFAATDADRPTVRIRSTVRHHGSPVRIGFVLVATLAGTFNAWFVYLPTHLASEHVHGLSSALGCAALGLVAAAAAAPAFGLVSDRVGRRPLLLGGTVALCCLVWPAHALATQGSWPALLIADVSMGVAIGSLVLPAHVAESFPMDVRATGIGLTYGLATALIGGTAPLVASVLQQRGISAAVPLYVLIVAVAGVLAAFRCQETLRRTS